MFRTLIATSNDYALTLLRITLGFVFFAHGAQKVLGWFGGNGFEGTMTAFTGSMGLPAAVALLVVLAEFLGSLGLIAGLLTRIAAAGIVAVMAGAIAMVHFQYGLFMNWHGTQQGEGYEFHLLALAIAVALVMRGAGALSLDRAIAGRVHTGARPFGHPAPVRG